jgi:hypothetical protein
LIRFPRLRPLDLFSPSILVATGRIMLKYELLRYFPPALVELNFQPIFNSKRCDFMPLYFHLRPRVLFIRLALINPNRKTTS